MMDATTFAAEHGITEATAVILLELLRDPAAAAEYVVTARTSSTAAQRQLAARLLRF